MTKSILATTLAISCTAATLHVGAQDFFTPASGATITLVDTGDAVVSDVVSANLQAAANLDELNLGVECSGLIVSTAPLLRIQYVQPQGEPQRSHIAVEGVSENVKALLVNSSDGSWYCANAVDGKVRWEIFGPNSGQIDVWPVLSSPRLQLVSVRAMLEPNPQ